MTETTADELQRRRNKRKRVQRIKLSIIAFIMISLLVSLIGVVVLGIKVVSLQNQLNEVTEVIRTTVQSGKKTEPVPIVKEEKKDTLKSGMPEDNLYQPGDIRKVYLTFDDSPGEYTEEILDILAKEEVKATFFVVGREDEASLALYRRIVDEGHTIGMHSYSHKYTDIYSSEEAFRSDLNKISSLIEETTSVKPVFYRFPGGSNNRVCNLDMAVFMEILKDQGIEYFDWNVSSGDATSQDFTPEELVENVMRDVLKYKTSVVLLHDGDDKASTVEALPSLIRELKNTEAELLPITEDTVPVRIVVPE